MNVVGFNDEHDEGEMNVKVFLQDLTEWIYLMDGGNLND